MVDDRRHRSPERTVRTTPQFATNCVRCVREHCIPRLYTRARDESGGAQKPATHDALATNRDAQLLSADSRRRLLYPLPPFRLSFPFNPVAPLPPTSPLTALLGPYSHSVLSLIPSSLHRGSACALPCHAMPCHAMPCRAVPCLVFPCHAIAMLCHAAAVSRLASSTPCLSSYRRDALALALALLYATYRSFPAPPPSRHPPSSLVPTLVPRPSSLGSRSIAALPPAPLRSRPLVSFRPPRCVPSIGRRCAVEPRFSRSSPLRVLIH